MNAAESVMRAEPVCGMETWFPTTAEILEARKENINTHTFKMRIVDDEIRKQYRWAPGQFNMLYVPGVGEAAISISSDSEEPEILEHTIRLTGSVTKAI